MAQADLIDREALDALLALVPEDKRDEARPLYSRVHDSAASAVGTLKDQEAALQRWHSQLRDWAGQKETEYQRRERELAERRAAGGDPNPNPNPKPAGGDPPAHGVNMDEINQHVAGQFENFGRAVVGSVSETLRLQQRHAQLYKGEQIFDPEELFKHPLARTAGLTAAFEEIHKSRISEAAEAARTAAEERIRQDERQKVLAEQAARGSTNLPFPTPGEDDSAIGILERRNAEQKEVFGADAAAAFYAHKQRTGAWPA